MIDVKANKFLYQLCFTKREKGNIMLSDREKLSDRIVQYIKDYPYADNMKLTYESNESKYIQFIGKIEYENNIFSISVYYSNNEPYLHAELLNDQLEFLCLKPANQKNFKLIIKAIENYKKN